MDNLETIQRLEKLMLQERVSFYADSLYPIRLEGMLDLPEEANHPPACILCHPHPIGGGSMYVPLLEAIARALTTGGWASLRFNFRGVGNSSGVSAGGILETEDVEGALQYLLERKDLDTEDLALAGWSFGAWVGLGWAVKSGRCHRICLVNPPLIGFDFFSFLEFERVVVPEDVLIISSENDQFASREKVNELAKRLEAETHILPGADHFLFGREMEVANIIAEHWKKP
jgi:uncharacterized protein